MMDTNTKPRRPRGGKYHPTHSIRVPEATWKAAQERAVAEGLSVSKVASLLISGYAHGALNAPEERVTYVSR